MASRNASSARSGFQYTPTFVALVNLDGAPTILGRGHVQRVGRMVQVSFRVTVDPTAAGSFSFRCTLPVPAGQLATDDIIGVGSNALSAAAGGVEADATTDQALCRGGSADVTPEIWSYTFTYLAVS